MKIKNINGTTQNVCRCGSWLEHWANFSGRTAYYCAALDCNETDLKGAHVQKADAADGNWYIVPLCKRHSRETGELEITDLYPLVSANKAETCAKAPRFGGLGM